MIELYDNGQLPMTFTSRDPEQQYPLVHGTLQFRDIKNSKGEERQYIVVVFTAFVRYGQELGERGLLPYFEPILREFAKHLKVVIFENAYSERGVYYRFLPGNPDAFPRQPGFIMRLETDLPDLH